VGTRQQLEEALSSDLENGESVVAWRPVLSNGRLEDRKYITTLALLGPTVYAAAARGALASGGQMPDHVNLVVITDQRVLWCSKGRLGGQIEVRGGDWLSTIAAVEVRPARVALAKLRFVFRDQSVVEFDLPSDHRAADFVGDIDVLLTRVPVAI